MSLAQSSSSKRMGVSRRAVVNAWLTQYHRTLQQKLAVDADVVFQRAVEKRKWSKVTSAYDDLPPEEQRMFAALALIEEGRELIEDQERIIANLHERRRPTLAAQEQLALLQADQARRAERLVTLQHQLDEHWKRLGVMRCA